MAVNAFVDQQNLDTIKIVISSDPELPDLPAAVEVAAYRIALEGITNVIRHAQATNVQVRLFPQNGSLIVEISDNGLGLPEPITIGVGITSMRERAEELSGQLQLIQRSPGTLLRACLPCPED
jgi:signal transduction histidine kinase